MNTAVFKETVAKLDEQMGRLLEIAESTGTQQDVVEQIKTLREKNQGENFKVLVMGEFSAGKSTMINALVGNPILPERALTATAIITEIKYGEEKKAVIYPIKGRWPAGDEPIELPLNTKDNITELKKYLLINHNIGSDEGRDANTMEGNVIASPFERAEIFLPVDILKDGVEIIDSPGLNDPASHGDITHNYLPNVHAIIYCVNGLRAYGQSEKTVLENLALKNFKTPIFLVTRYDNVVTDCDGDIEELEFFKKSITANLSQHTDLVQPQYTDMLDGNGIFFVSSPDAKWAKRSDPWDDALLEKSGYKDFERYLGTYLVRCKGDELSRMIVDSIKAAGRDTLNSLNAQYNAADLSLEEFEQRIAEVTAKMESAKAQAQLFVDSFELELENALYELKSICKTLPGEVYGKLDEWNNCYVCSVKREMLHVKRTAEAIAKEFEMHMQTKYENFIMEWSDAVLKPALAEKIKKIGERLKERANNLDGTINDIKAGLNLTVSASADDDSTSSKVASIIYGIVTWDFGIVGSGMVGIEDMIRGIVTSVGINIAVMLVFGSAALPVLIGAEIGKILIARKRNKDMIQKKVCSKILGEYKRVFSEPEEVEKIVNNIFGILSAEMSKLGDVTKESAFADIRQIEAETAQLLEDKKQGEEAVRQRKENITNWIADINDIIQTAEQIRADALA